MQISRRDFHHLFFAGLAGIAIPAQAASLISGQDYTLIVPSQPSDVPGKIEVLEFFSYGCSHCKDIHPRLMPWVTKLPADVVFRRVPVSFGRAAWTNLAKLHYALKIVNDLARIEDAVFRAIHTERTNLFTPAAIFSWVKQQGIDEKLFTAAFESFGVGAQVARDEQLVRSYKVQGVPLITVAGRYAATGHGDMLSIADGLIVMARKSVGV